MLMRPIPYRSGVAIGRGGWCLFPIVLGSQKFLAIHDRLHCRHAPVVLVVCEILGDGERRPIGSGWRKFLSLSSTQGNHEINREVMAVAPGIQHRGHVR